MDPVTIGFLVTLLAEVATAGHQMAADKYERGLSKAEANLASKYAKAYSKIQTDQEDIAGFMDYVGRKDADLAQAIYSTFGGSKQMMKNLQRQYRSAYNQGIAKQSALNTAKRKLENDYATEQQEIADARAQGSGLFGLKSNTDMAQRARHVNLPNPYSLDQPISTAYNNLNKSISSTIDTHNSASEYNHRRSDATNRALSAFKSSKA